MALMPLICMTIGILICSRYRLNKENHARVLAAIESGEDREEVLRLL
jgi:Na+/melibiose symporter-like transporter